MSIGAINVRRPFWPSTSVRYLRLRYLLISYSAICRKPICRTFLGKRLLEDCLKIQFSPISSKKYVLISKKNPWKMIQNDYITNNQWFRVTCIILHNLQNTNLQTLLEISLLYNFQIITCLNKHNKRRKLI